MAEITQGARSAFFAPQLTLGDVLAGVEFYKAAFGAIELRRWSNPDGTVHVAEMAIDGALFHLHEEVAGQDAFSPDRVHGTTASIGLFTADPDALMKKAVAAGGREISPMQDYDYGYRQGIILDPAGHRWILQKQIAPITSNG